MGYTPRQRALIRLDRLMRRGFPVAYKRRIKAARARLWATMAGHEIDAVLSITGSERRNKRLLVVL